MKFFFRSWQVIVGFGIAASVILLLEYATYYVKAENQKTAQQNQNQSP